VRRVFDDCQNLRDGIIPARPKLLAIDIGLLPLRERPTTQDYCNKSHGADEEALD
jgi:hypothetical protein